MTVWLQNEIYMCIYTHTGIYIYMHIYVYVVYKRLNSDPGTFTD